MSDGLILGDDLKMTNIVNLTAERIKKLTMDDLKMILNGLDETEQKHLITAIKDGKHEIIGHIIEYVTYRLIQRKVSAELKENLS